MGKKIIIHLNSMGKGGAERVVSTLASYLDERGWDVTVLTLWRSENEYEFSKGVKRINIGDIDTSSFRITRAVNRLRLLRTQIKKNRPDLVLSFCNKANFRSAYALTGTSIPLVVSVRNDPQVDYAPYKGATKYMEKMAKGCVFQTEDARAFFSEKLTKNAQIVMNPLNPKYLDKDWKKNFCGPIVTVGRVSEQKNQKMLIEAVGKLAEKIDNEIHIWGDIQNEEVKAQVDEKIKKYNLQDRVKYMGTTDSMEEVYMNAGIFALSSDFEGMPNALMEAMAVGVPVVSTDCPCGGPKTLIKSGENGELVPVGDSDAMASALLRVLKDNEYASKLGENAKTIRERQNPKRVLEQWEEYLENVI